MWTKSNVLNRPITNIKTPFAPQKETFVRILEGLFLVEAFLIKCNNTYEFLPGPEYTHMHIMSIFQPTHNKVTDLV